MIQVATHSNIEISRDGSSGRVTWSLLWKGKGKRYFTILNVFSPEIKKIEDHAIQCMIKDCIEDSSDGCFTNDLDNLYARLFSQVPDEAPFSKILKQRV